MSEPLGIELIEQERINFERMVFPRGLGLSRSHDPKQNQSNYECAFKQNAWTAWKIRASLDPKLKSEVESLRKQLKASVPPPDLVWVTRDEMAEIESLRSRIRDMEAKILDLDIEYIMCPNCECKIDMPTTGETK